MAPAETSGGVRHEDATPAASAPARADAAEDLAHGAADRPAKVVHLVGRVTDEVFSFLGPATRVLCRDGVPQTLILLDDPHYRHLVPRFDPSLRLVLLPCLGAAQRARAAVSALVECLNQSPGAAVHLHGALPSLIGVYATRVLGAPAGTLYFSPHGSKSLDRSGALGRALVKILRLLSGARRPLAIASAGSDADRLRSLTRDPVELVESTIDAAFLTAERRPARRPLIVTGRRAHNPKSAAFFAQLAVLLGEEELSVSFNWIGTADAESLARLAAANVKVYDDTEVDVRAQRLASGWLFVATGGSPGFPVYLAEAMAVGLPCVAWDTPYHRDLLRDGETGFLCSTEAQMIERIGQLVDSAELREQLGAAARAEALSRFDGERFRDSMRQIYRLRQSDIPA